MNAVDDAFFGGESGKVAAKPRIQTKPRSSSGAGSLIDVDQRTPRAAEKAVSAADVNFLLDLGDDGGAPAAAAARGALADERSNRRAGPNVA